MAQPGHEDPSGGPAGEPEVTDVESGDLTAEQERTNVNPGHDNSDGSEPDLGEFGNLLAYVARTSEQEKSKDDQQDEIVKQLRWYKYYWRTVYWEQKWGNKELVSFVAPNDWLRTDLVGLDAGEVESRRKLCGWNELKPEKKSTFQQVVGFFKGPILYAMELGFIIAFGLKDYMSGGIILGILILNAFVAWYQERGITPYKKDLRMKARVLREGREDDIPARNLVPGDIVIVDDGNTVPADIRLICDYFQYKPEEPANRGGFDQYTAELRDRDNAGPKPEKTASDDDEDEVPHIGLPLLAVDQSALTGESLAVDKYMIDDIFFSTICKRGKAYGIVTATGRSSVVGKTAALVMGVKGRRHLGNVMDSIGSLLLVMVIFSVLIAWVAGFFWRLKMADHEQNSLLVWALKLIIIGVPCGLPVVTMTTLYVGSSELAKDKAVVQELEAIESLAGVDVLCSDKTGTLTANHLSMREPYVMDGVNVNWMVAVAALASSHKVQKLDPIDKVTILGLKRYPGAQDILREGWETIKFTPFDPVNKRTEAKYDLNGTIWTCAKGAPKSMLAMSKCSKEQELEFREKAAEFARRGMRSLAVAVKEGDGNWQLLGMFSISDPPRPDTRQTIEQAKGLGLTVKMLTGDAVAIAKETCRQLGLGAKVYNSDKLLENSHKVPGSSIHEFIERADGFAEVFPEHKYQVVEFLQERGHLTAMTGDGVNDAPSLRLSDCGIAVEGSTEAAQAAADIVFLRPGLGTIIKAIKNSRQIFQRMKAYIQYRIALCIHLELFLVLDMMITRESLNVDQLALLALFADLATITTAYDRAHIEPRPVEWQIPKIWFISIVLGVSLTIGTGLLRIALAKLPIDGQAYLPLHDTEFMKSVLFLQIALSQNWTMLATRGFSTWPSLELLYSIASVDLIAIMFTLFGVRMARVDGDFVGVVVLYSLIVNVVLGILYYYLSTSQWVSSLGRKRRSPQETMIEDVVTQLGKVAFERFDEAGNIRGRYMLTTKAEDEEDEY